MIGLLNDLKRNVGTLSFAPMAASCRIGRDATVYLFFFIAVIPIFTFFAMALLFMKITGPRNLYLVLVVKPQPEIQKLQKLFKREIIKVTPKKNGYTVSIGPNLPVI